MKQHNHTVVRPRMIDDVLVNPGIGFTTFQRFNGDELNKGNGWTEGHPIEYQPFQHSYQHPQYPPTSIAYFRIYWRYLESSVGEYNWEIIDRALATARERKQTLMLRIAPHASSMDAGDVPDWYREMVGERTQWLEKKWLVDPEDPRYVQYYGGMIRAAGERYNGHPDLESVDLAFLGAWGEGEGAHRLTSDTREALVDAYMDSFTQTPLTMMLTDAETNGYALSRGSIGWRVDCLGDMKPDGAHMLDCYPQQIIMTGMKDAWEKGPVSMEVCYVLQSWKDKGWDIEYNIEQSLKWHISSFNAKSSPVPQEWEPYVEQWLKRMGYRFVLRKFTYPPYVKPGGKMEYTSWWENVGVAPCYRKYPLALRLRSAEISKVIELDCDIRQWLPGDHILDGAIRLPRDFPLGVYELELGVLSPYAAEPAIRLAIEGRQDDGWYSLGSIQVQQELEPPPSPHSGVLSSPW